MARESSRNPPTLWIKARKLCKTSYVKLFRAPLTLSDTPVDQICSFSAWHAWALFAPASECKVSPLGAAIEQFPSLSVAELRVL